MLMGLRYSIEAVLRGLRRLRWGSGAAASFGILSLCVIYSLLSPAEYAVSALLKIDFVCAGTNAASLSPEHYGTNSIGWGPFNTEARFLSSELVVRRALQRISASGQLRKALHEGVPDSPDAVAAVRDKLQVDFTPDGLRLRAVGGNPREVAAVVNAIAEVYQQERNEIAPVPPGCKRKSITTTEKAHWSTRPLYFVRLPRFGLGAVLLGLAVGLWFSKQPPGNENPFIETFLRWLALGFGGALLLTRLGLGLILVGATVWAFLIATGAGCVALVVSKTPPVHPKVFPYTFRTVFILLVGAAVLWRLIGSEEALTSARVRVSIRGNQGNDELASTYDARLLATECRLIASSCILGSLDDPDSRKALAKHYGYNGPLGEREARYCVIGKQLQNKLSIRV